MLNQIDINTIQNLIYIIASVMFICGIKMLGKEATAVKGKKSFKVVTLAPKVEFDGYSSTVS